MTNIIDFNKAAKSHLKQKNKQAAVSAKKQTMCKNNHHKWRIQTSQQFDVKEGKLVTVYQCEHCGLSKNKLN